MSSSKPFDPTATVRRFTSGATRNTDTGKLDYEGFLSPFVLKRFAQYMHKHRLQTDGTMRPSDNWQKGIPREAYAASLLRHVMDFWMQHRTDSDGVIIEDALCAIMFNAMGYLFEVIKER